MEAIKRPNISNIESVTIKQPKTVTNYQSLYIKEAKVIT